DEAGAPRIIVVLETGVSLAVHSACADLAAGLADRTRMPVTLASIPACCLEALRPTLGRARESRIRDYAPAPPPAPMSAAPFLLREDGRPDWGAMWSSFCELALYGGPPHRGPDNPLRAPEASAADSASEAAMVEEMRRGIWETTGLYAEPTGGGWLAVACGTRAMGARLCATLLLQNPEGRGGEDRRPGPPGPRHPP